MCFCVPHERFRNPDRSLPYSQALPGGHFPAFNRYYEAAKTSHAASRQTFSACLPVPFHRLLYSLAVLDSHHHSAWTLFSRYRHLLRRISRKDGAGSPLSPVSPPVSLPCSSTPVGPASLGHPAKTPVLSLVSVMGGRQQLATFRGSFTRL
jgi:hypothetical protein